MKFFSKGSSTPPPPPAPGVKPATPATPAIVGRWKDPKESDTTEFHADGRVTEKPSSGETIRGRYTLDGTKLKIRLDGVPNELSFTAAIKDNKLEMTGPDGQMSRYDRVP